VSLQLLPKKHRVRNSMHVFRYSVPRGRPSVTCPGISWAGPFSPSKLSSQAWGPGLPSNTQFLGSTQVHTPNIISIGSAVFAQLMEESPYTLQC